MNKVILIGNLGQDPEMKYCESGSKVAKFSLALRSYNKKEQKDQTDWVSCEAWEKTAETIGEYCKKGHRIAVEGSLKTQNWEKDGQKHSKTFVLVQKIEFLTSKNSNSNGDNSTPTETEPTQTSLGMDVPIPEFPEEEIPF